MRQTLFLFAILLAPLAALAEPVFQAREPSLGTFFDQFDVLTLWTWNSDEIPEMEGNLAALENLAPKTARIALGLYFWDFENRRPVPEELMKHQCDLGLKWLREADAGKEITEGLSKPGKDDHDSHLRSSACLAAHDTNGDGSTNCASSAPTPP